MTDSLLSKTNEKAWRLFDAAFHEAARFRVDGPGDPRHGAWISPDTGRDEPSHTGQGKWFMFLYLAYLSDAEHYGRARLLGAMEACGTAWMRVRRPSGRIDLRNCNPDSGPDTAFLLQQLLACFELGRLLRPDDGALRSATESTVVFAREAACALVDGGVHTPNHRWVVVSALAQAGAFWPDLRPLLEPAARAFMAEGPDIDGEGAFIERSVAVYDAVNVRSLILAHEYLGWPEGLAAAGRCLDFDLDLFHADGTVDTQLSHRFDHGTRPVPVGLMACYLMHARVGRHPSHAGHAAWMLRQCRENGEPDAWSIIWVVAEILRGNGFPLSCQPPPDVERHHVKNRIVRIRRAGAGLSLYGGSNRLASFLYGRAYLHSVMAGQSYLGHGRFVGDEIHGGAGRYVMESRGRLDPHRLGYAQALGRPVAPENWTADYAQRALRPLPDCASRIDIEWVEGRDEVCLHYRTVEGLPDVTAQISFDFEPGGTWETGDCAFKPGAGQVLVLRGGSGRMEYGGDWIRISGGADFHRPWAMRDYPPADGRVRVAVPLCTPVDHVVRITWGRDGGAWS